MTSFSPANEDHAITSVAFSLVLNEFIEPPTLAAAAAVVVKDTWREGLPAAIPLPNVTIRADGQEGQVQAMQLAIVRPDARPIWAVKFNGFELVVECTAYTRWNEVSEQAIAYLNGAFALVLDHQPGVQITNARLRVVDEFVSRESYEPRDIFQTDSFLGSLPYRGVGPWHMNVGFIEENHGQQILDVTNVNLSTSRKDNAIPIAPYRLAINHLQTINPASVGTISLDQFETLIQDMHLRNKTRLGEVIIADMAKRIGL